MTTAPPQQTGPRNSGPRLIILIPAYNAESQVQAVIHGAAGTGLQVVVVDDGSTDQTGARAQAAGATVLRHHGNRGKGAALQTGFAYATRLGTDGVLTLDADGQHDPAEIGKLLSAWTEDPSRLVMGVRSFDPALMPRRSRIGNHISTFFISLFAGRRHSDTQTGFRVYPRRLFRLPLRTRRFDTETELLLCASKLGVPLCEVPIQTIYAVPTPAAAATAPSASSDLASASATPGAETSDSPKSPPRTHFRNWEDTLRVLGLVISSPWWGPSRLQSDDSDVDPAHAPSDLNELSAQASRT